MRTLLVEDDEMIRKLVRGLERSGWSVDWVRDGLLAQNALADGSYTCVLLDLGLPKADGLEVLRRARDRKDDTPILILTARDGLGERVQGLDLGADDYLLKPFELAELLARMRAVVRRRHGASNSILGSGSVQLDLTTREVLHNGKREALTAREFALMHTMLERPGAIFSREQLESRIYGWGEEVMSNAVDVIDTQHASQAGSGCDPQRSRARLARRGHMSAVPDRPRTSARYRAEEESVLMRRQGRRWYPPTSLRTRLLLWLVLVHLLAAAGVACSPIPTTTG